MEDLLEKMERVRRWFYKKRLEYMADDAAQEYALYRLEGKAAKQAPEQFAVDYLRRQTGDPRHSSHGVRQALEFALGFSPMDEDAVLRCDHSVVVKRHLDAVRFIKAIVDDRDRDIAVKAYFGWKQEDIAQHHGLTTSMVGKIMNRISKLPITPDAKVEHEVDPVKGGNGDEAAN